MKIEWIDQRLTRWAAWSLRGGLVHGLWYARCTFGADPLSGGEMVDAKLDQEAVETHSAVSRLMPVELREAVQAYYCGRGTVKQRARDAGCSEATLHRRVDHAHERLAVLLEQKRAWPAQCTFSNVLTR